jgi:hypothetical protein
MGTITDVCGAELKDGDWVVAYGPHFDPVDELPMLLLGAISLDGSYGPSIAVRLFGGTIATFGLTEKNSKLVARVNKLLVSGCEAANFEILEAALKDLDEAMEER